MMVVALAFVVSVGASDASAARDTYCGVTISSGTWCGNGAINHSYYDNAAAVDSTSGSGRVCERHRLDSNPSDIRGSGPHCSPVGGTYYNWCYSNPGQTTQQWRAEVQQTYSGSRTLYGIAYYGVGEPSNAGCNV